MATTRFATYNVHNARPRKGRADLALFQNCVKALQSDVTGMQEVDRGMLRTRRADMTTLAATAIGGAGFFADARRRWDMGEYGNCLVTTGSFADTEILRYERPKVKYERRVAQIANVVVNGVQWSVANTHLSLHADEQVLQLQEVAAQLENRDAPKVLMGDFNLLPEVAKATLEPLGWTVLESAFTYSSWEPSHTVDFICVQGAIAEHVEVMSLEISDHAALVADLRPDIRFA